jgi:hypothetical protein
MINQRTVKGWPNHIKALTLGETNSVCEVRCHLCDKAIFYNNETGQEWNQKVTAFVSEHQHQEEK